MSRVFTFEELQLGRVPKHQDFDDTLSTVRSAVPYMPGIVGAVIFGSALTGNFRPTSDIDVFVVFDEGSGLRLSQDSLKGLRQLSSSAAVRNVPIDWLPNTKQQLADDCHTLRAGGLDHIMWGAEHGGIIGENPCLFVLHTGQRQREARDYVIMALDKLTRAKSRWDILTESERNKVRSKALDRPIAAARRALEIRDRQICSWTGKQVIDALNNSTLTRLGTLSDSYQRIIEKQLEHPDERRYRDFLDKILDQQALELAHDFFAELLESELR